MILLQATMCQLKSVNSLTIEKRQDWRHLETSVLVPTACKFHSFFQIIRSYERRNMFGKFDSENTWT